jgi:hypothetical protein
MYLTKLMQRLSISVDDVDKMSVGTFQLDCVVVVLKQRGGRVKT